MSQHQHFKLVMPWNVAATAAQEAASQARDRAGDVSVARTEVTEPYFAARDAWLEVRRAVELALAAEVYIEEWEHMRKHVR